MSVVQASRPESNGGAARRHWFRQECDRAGLPNCSAHGLRKAAARRLAEAGCTAHEIGAITGHITFPNSCATPGRPISAGSPRRPWPKRENPLANRPRSLPKKPKKHRKSKAKNDGREPRWFVPKQDQ